VVTIEGISTNGKLHPVQEGFWQEHGLQCGFCTPGMIMTSRQLLERNPTRDDAEIRHALEGNLCRCTGYHTLSTRSSAAAAIGKVTA
jgi:carbon-monoxide dehydrogenase small subunit